MDLILASASDARKKVMDSLGLPYRVVPARFDEKSIRDGNPVRLVRLLSEAKAREVGLRNPGSVVVGGDVIVECMGEVYEKPRDPAEASSMLQFFSGKSVRVISGVAVHDRMGIVHSEVSSCVLAFKKLGKEEIESYISSNNVLAFAGAFDSAGARRFSKISGNPYVLDAIDRKSLVALLREAGIELPKKSILPPHQS